VIALSCDNSQKPGSSRVTGNLKLWLARQGARFCEIIPKSCWGTCGVAERSLPTDLREAGFLPPNAFAPGRNVGQHFATRVDLALDKAFVILDRQDPYRGNVAPLTAE
jgi:hypothetical protein